MGLGDTHHNFTNKKLEKDRRYRIFVRAVVDTPQKHLYTSSPFSEYLSLNMREAPPGEAPHRPNPNLPHDIEVSVNKNKDEPEMVWIFGPMLLAIVMCTCLVAFYIMKRRRQPCKAPDQSQVTRPLMAADLGAGPAPTDPVDMRRLNFQTPGMVSHPPIPISDFANHLERLKSNDNLKFSQEYESIEPGQQFMWDHSNMECNKPKNRYANVTAYDHSRVILQSIEGRPGSK